MSTKTLRKRIALVAVSALGAGMLSLVAVPAANAASTVTKITSMNIHANASNGAAADYTYASGGSNTIASQGLVADPTAAANGTGTTQTAAMYSNGTIVVSTASTDAAQKISVTGGSIVGATANTADTVALAADLSYATRADGAAAGILIVGIQPKAAGTPLVITGYDNTSNAANWAITVTVVAPGSAGTFSAGYSDLALTAAGSAPATANVDTVGANIAENGSCIFMYYSLKDALGLPMATTTTIIATATAGFKVNLTTGTSDTNIYASTYGGSATYIKVCQNAANANKPVSGTLKFSVNGTDVLTKDIKIVGQLAKITVSEDAIAIRGFAGGTGTPSSTLYGSSPYGTAGDTTSTAYFKPSHSYMGYDSAGNTVPVTAAVVSTTYDAQVIGYGQIQAADPRNSSAYIRSGGISWNCADASGSNAKLQVKATAADTTTIYSNVFNVTCAGYAVNYTAKSDKSSYNTGDVATFTVNFTDKSGKPINDYAYTSVTDSVGTIASGAIKSNVTVPAATDTAVAGVAKYKYIIDQTGGNFTVAVDFPTVDNATYSQSALTLPVTVVSAGTSNTEVLAAIVKLIASINKQIAALQKALLKKK